MDLHRDEQRVRLIVYHLIVYHLVWRPKRRKLGPVAARCQGLIAGKCAERG